MHKKLSYHVFIFILFFIFFIPTTKASAALLIGGDSYETVDDGWGVNYLSIKPVIERLEGVENPYGFDMKDKIDFNNIILVGHSRGGQNLFLGYDILKEMGYQVKGTLSIAPANYWPAFSNYPDVPVGIILPQLDGDVHTMDGRQIFDRMRSKERKMESE